MSKKIKSIDIAVGKRLYAKRKEAGLTLTSLAEKVKISHTQIRKYEKGIDRLFISNAFEISKALNFTLSELFHNISGEEDQELENLTHCVEKAFAELLKVKNGEKILKRLLKNKGETK